MEQWSEGALVSVIIPCYNAESTLKQCLDSVLDQSYRNLEVLVIDDGSADQSRAIVQSYAEKETRIRLIGSARRGVSYARNQGILHARGQYLQFVDADDYLLKNATGILVDCMEAKKADWVLCDYRELWQEQASQGERSGHVALGEGMYRKRDFLKQLARYPNAHYYGVVWNKLYRKQLVDQNHLQFPLQASMGEDFWFNMEYLTAVSRIYCLEKPLYVYRRQQPCSLSGRQKKEADKIAERVFLYDAYWRMFCREGLQLRWRYRILYYMVKYYFDELEELGEEASVYQALLYEECIRKTNIHTIEFAVYFLLKKGKRMFQKRRRQECGKKG